MHSKPNSKNENVSERNIFRKCVPTRRTSYRENIIELQANPLVGKIILILRFCVLDILSFKEFYCYTMCQKYCNSIELNFNIVCLFYYQTFFIE